MFWFVIQNRQSLGRLLQGALAWALLFVAVLAGYALWEDIRGTLTPTQAVIAVEQRIEVPRSPDGHFHLTLEINGAPVRFIMDTGASDMVLTEADARRAGINVDELAFHGRARTANGEIRTAPVWIDRVALSPFVDEDVRASVNTGDMPGSLLGMSYLDRWSRLEIAGRQLVLER